MSDFRNDRYYCLLCALHPDNEHNRFVTVGGVRIHLENPRRKNGHRVRNPQPGKHYVSGYTARRIFRRRQTEAEEEAKDFANCLAELYTAEDFLLDTKPKTA